MGLNKYLKDHEMKYLERYELVILPDGTEGRIAEDFGNGVFLIETETAFVRFDTNEYKLEHYHTIH